MKFFRHNNNWLRYRINIQMKLNHEDLYEPTLLRYYRCFRDYIFDRRRWWLIFGFVCLFLFASFLPIGLQQWFGLSEENAHIIIDQRTSNIAAIISMTLAVIGFLIGNLAIKEPFAFNILFKHSRLYPIIYFILSTVASLIVISSLRDKGQDIYYYPNLVIMGTIMVLFSLFCIGYLFRTIIHFTNSKRIWALLREALKAEATIQIKKSLVIWYSREEYKKFLEMHGAKRSDFSDFNFAMDFVVGEDNGEVIEAIKEKELIVSDINLHGISVWLHTKTIRNTIIYYKELMLDTVILKTNDFIWALDENNTEKEEKELRNLIVLENKNKNEPVEYENTPVRKHYDDKFEEWSDLGKYKDIEELLDSYYQLYEMEMKHNL